MYAFLKIVVEAQRDLTPEHAADTIRDQSEIHLSERHA
jgi:galactose-1-phosphate uridylyltransferase